MLICPFRLHPGIGHSLPKTNGTPRRSQRQSHKRYIADVEILSAAQSFPHTNSIFTL